MTARTASITIGVPVYNSAEFLRGSLECLRDQTFRDFEVLISDNASTDETARIAAEFAEKDSRFRLIRQDSNKGPVHNFYDVLKHARSPYFLWRADDDRSDLNYLEALHALLAANPDKDLAVAPIEVSDLDGARRRSFGYLPGPGKGSPLRGLALLFLSHTSWFYGLFRREAALEAMEASVNQFRHYWGFDNAVLLPFLLDNKVIGTNATRFWRIEKRRGGERMPQTTRPPEPLLRIALRRRLLRIAHSHIAARSPSMFGSALWNIALWFYVGRNVFDWHRTVYHTVRIAALEGRSVRSLEGSEEPTGSA